MNVFPDIKKPVLLFDGVCNYCSGWVNFFIRLDRKKKLLFAPLQSESGQKLLKGFGLPTQDLDTIVLIDGDKSFTKTNATFMVFRKLPFPWYLLYGMTIIPAFIRDFFYDVLSRYRYRLFGKKDHCLVPTPDIKERFLP